MKLFALVGGEWLELLYYEAGETWQEVSGGRNILISAISSIKMEK